MTSPDFDRWWQDFLERWPDMGEWFMEGRSEEQQVRILRNWSQALKDVDLDEALAINKAMYGGDLQGFTGRWDRDRIPAIVRGLAIAQRPAPSTWTGPNDDPYPQPNDTKPVGLNGVLHDLIGLQKAGVDHAQCQEFLRKKFPAEPLDRQRRYKCLTCFDTGYVWIWHDERVYLAATKGIEDALACTYQTMTAACPCDAGNKFTGGNRPLVRFDSQKHCLAPGADVSSPKAVAFLQDWLQTRRDVRRRANYEPGFASYSQQEAF